MSLKGDLPASMEAAAILDLAHEAIGGLLSARYPERKGLHASDMTDASGSRHRKVSTQKLMLQGWYAEQKWVDIFREAGILVFPNGNRPPDHESGVLYTPDAVIRPEGAHHWETEGWRVTDYIIEIKSVGSDVFQEVQRFGWPYQKHFLRTQLYLYLSGVGRAFILYENRDTLDVWMAPVGPLTPHQKEQLNAYVAQKAEPFAETEEGPDGAAAPPRSAVGSGESLDSGSGDTSGDRRDPLAARAGHSADEMAP